MDKRYQIFISSTFIDLIEERQAALKAILEIDHMPAGMELFPPTDETAWQLIQDVIKASDYYLLIVGGRYGSLDDEGLGYTEKEYDYAVSLKKPVIPLLHQDPAKLPRESTETSEEAWKKLEEFRNKVEEKHTCVYWDSTSDLKAKVIVGLTSVIKRYPAIGWVRADEVPSGATIKEILQLKEKVSSLEKELDEKNTNPPSGSEELAGGDDEYKLNLTFKTGHYASEQSYSATIKPTWNDIFASIAPVMINEATESQLRSAFKKSLSSFASQAFSDHEELEGKKLHSFSFDDHQIDTCIVQLRALGLMRESTKKRSVRDTATYWELSPYGDQLMVQLRALRKNPREDKKSGTIKDETDA